jgi:hypothetical protein
MHRIRILPDIQPAGNPANLKSVYRILGMHRILFLPDIRSAGYPANLKAGYRISGRISGKCRIPDIRPDIRPNTWLDTYIFGQISNKIYKTA